MTDTPTPQMTPEQRAHFCRLLNNARLGECANRLEADGVTIATITAERDALAAAQTDLKAADAQIELLLKNHNGLTAEIARLTAALATAREDGMREGAEALRKTWWRGELTSEDFAAVEKGAAT